MPNKKLSKYATSKKEADKSKYRRPEAKYIVQNEAPDHVFKYGAVESKYRPCMNIAQDF